MELNEINCLVAEHIMNWEVVNREYSIVDKGSGFPERFEPTVGMEDAWLVVDKMKEANYSARHRFVMELQKEVTPKAFKSEKFEQALDLGWLIFFLTPKAICLSALRTAGIEF